MPPSLILVGLAGIAALLLKAKSASAASSSTPTVPTGPWPKGYAASAAAIRAYAKLIEREANWPGLGDFLAAVAFTESRGVPTAGTLSGNNAVGLFGMRPKSAMVDQLGLRPADLLSPIPAIALAAYYAHRLQKYRASGQTVTWLDLRRGWALPELVSDVDETKERSVDVRERMLQAVAAAGLPDAFMYQPAFSASYAWPGFERVLELLRKGPEVA